MANIFSGLFTGKPLTQAENDAILKQINSQKKAAAPARDLSNNKWVQNRAEQDKKTAEIAKKQAAQRELDKNKKTATGKPAPIKVEEPQFVESKNNYSLTEQQKAAKAEEARLKLEVKEKEAARIAFEKTLKPLTVVEKVDLARENSMRKAEGKPLLTNLTDQRAFFDGNYQKAQDFFNSPEQVKIREERAAQFSNVQEIGNFLSDEDYEEYYNSIYKLDKGGNNSLADPAKQKMFEEKAEARKKELAIEKQSIQDRFGRDTLTLPDGSTAKILGYAPNRFSSAFSEGVDLRKLGDIINTDKGQFVSYSKDFLDGKGNVIKGKDKVSVISPLYLTKNSDKAFAGGNGQVLVPYDGTSVIYNKASTNNLQGYFKVSDTPLFGKTIQMPDGSYQTVAAVREYKDGGVGLHSPNGNSGNLILATLDGSNKYNEFAYFDEKFAQGGYRGGDGANGYQLYSEYLSANKDKAKYIDLSGIGDKIGNAGSKGVIVPYDGTSGLVNSYGWYTKKKKGLFGGGFLGEIAADIGSVFSNPVVQLGVSLLPGGAAVVAGYNAGNAFANGGLESALKSAAVGLAAGAAGNAAGKAFGNLTGATSNSIVDSAIRGAAEGATTGTVGAALTGQDIKDSLISGVIGGGLGGATNSILNQVFPNVPKDQVDGTVEVEPTAEEVVSGGKDNPIGDLNLPTNTLIGDKPISFVGINQGNFKPDADVNLNNLGGTFDSEPGLKLPNTPTLGSDNGVGITIPLFNADGTKQGFQGTGGSVSTNPDFNSTLGSLGSTLGNVGVQPPNTTTTTPSTPAQPQPQTPVPVGNNNQNQAAKNALQKLLEGLVGTVGNKLTQSLTGNNQGTQGGFTNTGANMADYSGLIGNLLGQNQQINRLEDTGNQIAGNYNAAAQELNKPFTPFNITTGAGSTQVQGNNINQTLTGGQQQLANLAGTAAGMFGDVNIPNAENIRNTALQGSQNLLQQAQGFNPQSAAQQEFDALQQLYAPQRERDRMALENRLRMQGRLGASDNPALRQLEESFRQQDLQGAIQSRNLGFERQQQLQNLSQGMFNQGSQAAKLPTELQATRAQIGNTAGMLSQQPFQTANQQAQLANQLAATQATQGTSLANIMATLKDRGLTNQAGLISQAAALKNARDVAALQGLFGGNGTGGVSGAINQVGNAAGNALSGLVGSGINAIGGYLGGLFGSNNAAMPVFNNPANLGFSPEELNNMSDDEFLDAILFNMGS